MPLHTFLWLWQKYAKTISIYSWICTHTNYAYTCLKGPYFESLASTHSKLCNDFFLKTHIRLPSLINVSTLFTPINSRDPKTLALFTLYFVWVCVFHARHSVHMDSPLSLQWMGIFWSPDIKNKSNFLCLTSYYSLFLGSQFPQFVYLLVTQTNLLISVSKNRGNCLQ